MFSTTKSEAALVLEDALRILKMRGWTPGVCRNMITGEVDIFGAIAIASGVRISQIDDQVDAVIAAIPEGRRPAAYMALDASEWAVDCDLTVWQDQPDRSFSDVKKVLQKASEHLRIAAS